MIELHTERLRIRDFVADDFDDIYAFESDPDVVKYVAYGPYTPDECRRDLTWHIEHQSILPRRYFHFALALPTEKRVIGWCGVQFERDDRHEAEIGYAMHPDFHGYGYITEAAQAVLAYSFTELSVHRVFAECAPENTASVAVLQRLNMRQEGRLRENRYFKGRRWDTLIFGVLRHEWEENQ